MISPPEIFSTKPLCIPALQTELYIAYFFDPYTEIIEDSQPGGQKRLSLEDPQAFYMSL